MATNLTHECPVDGCNVEIEAHRVMCVAHWRLVPSNLSLELIHARDRRGQRDRDWKRDAKRIERAVHACIDAVNEHNRKDLT